MQVGTFPPPPFVLEELELMTAQLFDGQQVQQAVQKALTSLEAAVGGEVAMKLKIVQVLQVIARTSSQFQRLDVVT